MTSSIAAAFIVLATCALPSAAEYRTVTGEVVAPSCTADEDEKPY